MSHGPSSAMVPAGERRVGGAFWMSVLLHGSAVVLAVLLTMTLHEKDDPPPQVFELVAGDGTDFNATEAPAGAEPPVTPVTQVKSVREWTPPELEAEPLPTPVQPVPPAPAPTPTVQPTSELAQVKMKKPKQVKPTPLIPTPTPSSARPATEARQTVNYDEFRKENKIKSTTPRAQTAPGPTPRLNPEAIKRGVTGGTGANSAGAGGRELTASEGAAMERYLAVLRQQLRINHEKPAGLSDLLWAEVTFTMAANGRLSGMRITRSSGNAEFDRSVIDAFVRVGSVGPRPDGKTGSSTLIFRMRDG
jgi:colicin import membrane protein